MPTRNVNLTELYDQFIEEQIDAGRYRNASEVVRAGLHLLKQQTQEEQERLKLLRALAAEAFAELDQGRGITIEGRKQLSNVIRDAGKRAAKRAKSRQQRG